MSPERRAALQVLGAMVALMWCLEIVDVLLGGDLDRHGIRPRDLDAVPEIASAPFLHVGFGHLIGNTIPFLAMGAAIAWAGLRRLLAVTGIVGLVSGAGVWLIAASGSVHLGASGLVFGYAAYLISRGLFSRRIGELVLGAVVVGVWGLTLLGGLVPQPQVSWQAHAFGAVGGVIAARLAARRRRPAELLTT